MILTVGYEDETLDGLVDRLAAAGVSAVVDVRLTPLSRKPGLSKRRLAEALDRRGIAYVHEPGLGNPADNRDAFRRGDPEARRRFRAVAAGPGAPALDRVVARAQGERIALLCVERDDGRCHRAVVADLATERDPGIEVLPLP